MKCYFCKFSKYEDEYNIDIDKKSKNNFSKLETKNTYFNENENIKNLFNEKNHDFDIQIIKYPENNIFNFENKKEKTNSNLTENKCIYDKSTHYNSNSNNFNFELIDNINNQDNDNKIENNFIKKIKRDSSTDGKFYRQQPNLIYNKYFSNSNDKKNSLESILKYNQNKIKKNNNKRQNYSERIESKEIE